MYLTDFLILRDILFVPEFQCNLISVSHMLVVNSCTIEFTNAMCAIQDRISGRLIGPGERRVEL